MKHEFEKYCHKCGTIIDKRTDLCPVCGAKQPNNQDFSSDVNINVNARWLITVLLCGFLGYLGVHRFYTGHIVSGILQLITGGGLGIWWIIDLIIIITGQFKDKEGYYIRMR